MVDGAWGIGKSYMVRKALEDMKDRTCFISLFGMDDVQKIYHEAFFQLALRTSHGGKIASGAKGFAKAAGNFCAEVANLNGALAQAISERELFAVTASNFTTLKLFLLPIQMKYMEMKEIHSINIKKKLLIVFLR